MKKKGAKKLPEKTKKPLFIAVEGGEGSGKSSLIVELKAMFGDKIFTTREPGGSPYAEVIRDVTVKNPLAKTAPAETTLCLMFAARFDNTVNSIVPALQKGLPVVADRYDASSYALNVCAQSGGSLEKIFWELRAILSVVPDLYIFIDADPITGLRRVANRNQPLLKGYDHFDDRDVDFHEKVRAGYKKFFKKVLSVTIDANRPFEEVKKDFLRIIKEKLEF